MWTRIIVVMTNLDSMLKNRDSTLSTEVRLVKAMVFAVVMYGCESWTVKKAERRRIDAFELWCWRRLSLSLIFFLGFYCFILIYNIVLVLPYINMNLPQVYTCSQSWTPLPLPSPYHPSGHPSAPGPSILYPAWNLDWQFISCFFNDPMDVGNMVSSSSAFSKSSLNSWKFLGSRTVETWLGDFWALLC